MLKRLNTNVDIGFSRRQYGVKARCNQIHNQLPDYRNCCTNYRKPGTHNG